jgi:hypothetical protein
MVFDSFAALLLFAASVGAWALLGSARAASRLPIRFAATLFAAFAAAGLLGALLPQLSLLAPAVGLIALSLGTTALALGLFAFLARPLPAGAAALGLSLSLGAGLAAALSGMAVYTLCCVIPGVSLSLAASLGAGWGNPIRTSLVLMAALSLLLGGFALMDGGTAIAQLFFAAALLGAARASQKLVEIEMPAQTIPRAIPQAAIGFRGR